jgi:hypothetical protein
MVRNVQGITRDFAYSACFAIRFLAQGHDLVPGMAASTTGVESAVPVGKEHGTAKHAEHADTCLSGQA